MRTGSRSSVIGFVGKEAEIKTTRNNKQYAILSVATSRSWKNRETGEYVRDTTWHRCIVWAGRARFAATLTKGAHVQIEGAIRNYQRPAKGAKAARPVTQRVVTGIDTLDRPPKTSAAQAETPAGPS